ncbi:MAG: DAK2 domain-containing protein [Clostridia bacterium]|nr:DAK2 domain-containing protein [Clostridia bacterium]
MINGRLLRDAFISASNNIANNRQAVDELNVFPVPDGDTGTNMSMTISAAARELERIGDDAEVGEVAKVAASALLRGARGNSGVILSLLFRGFSTGLRDKVEANGADLANALTLGVAAAYKAVMKPTEGTILTVSRVAGEEAAKKATETDDVIEVWQTIINAAIDALEKTPEQLPVLKKAGVVDAGGKGLVVILEGMMSVFKDNVIIKNENASASAPVVKATTAVADSDEEIKFGYCTEYIVDRDKKIDRDPIKLRAYLESIGDCVVVVDDESIIKVHVHTNDPGNAIQEGLKFGSLINIKVDNMRHQHKSTVIEAEKVAEAPITPVKPERKYGFVAVGAGDGVCQLFTELGVDKIVRGGQTMNPSTDDILHAVEATPARHVFILPNNKNIIMAAEQVAPLSSRKVHVLHTKTIPQGFTALLNFDETVDSKTNHMAMMKAAEQVSTGLVTFAARNSHYDGQSIKKNQILGIENGKVALVEEDVVKAAYKVAKHLYKKGTHSVITIIYGNGMTQQQADNVQELLSAKLGGDVDITVVEGGQPVYYFIISVE